MLLQLREDDQGGGPQLKDIFWAPHLKGLFWAPHLQGLRGVQDQGLGCSGLGHNGNACKSPVSTVLSGRREAPRAKIITVLVALCLLTQNEFEL